MTTSTESFLDLPTWDERRAVLEQAIAKWRRSHTTFLSNDVDVLAAIAREYVGPGLPPANELASLGRALRESVRDHQYRALAAITEEIDRLTLMGGKPRG